MAVPWFWTGIECFLRTALCARACIIWRKDSLLENEMQFGFKGLHPRARKHHAKASFLLLPRGEEVVKLLDVGHLVSTWTPFPNASGTDAFGSTVATVENAAARAFEGLAHEQ